MKPRHSAARALGAVWVFVLAAVVGVNGAGQREAWLLNGFVPMQPASPVFTIPPVAAPPYSVLEGADIPRPLFPQGAVEELSPESAVLELDAIANVTTRFDVWITNSLNGGLWDFKSNLYVARDKGRFGLTATELATKYDRAGNFFYGFVGAAQLADSKRNLITTLQVGRMVHSGALGVGLQTLALAAYFFGPNVDTPSLAREVLLRLAGSYKVWNLRSTASAFSNGSPLDPFEWYQRGRSGLGNQIDKQRDIEAGFLYKTSGQYIRDFIGYGRPGLLSASLGIPIQFVTEAARATELAEDRARAFREAQDEQDRERNRADAILEAKRARYEREAPNRENEQSRASHDTELNGGHLDYDRPGPGGIWRRESGPREQPDFRIYIEIGWPDRKK